MSLPSAPAVSAFAHPHRLRAWCTGLVCALASVAQAADPGGVSGIFVCVDAQGRRITSDRPIPECANREQREVTAAGTVRRVIAPHLSAEERAAAEQRQEAEAAQKALEQEQQRRDRALLSRYPQQTHHDAERNRQLALLNESAATLARRGDELRRAEQEIRQEMEFYRANPAKAPAWLTRKLADNTEQQQRHQQTLAQQQEEKLRVNRRFDEELARLKPLWASASNRSSR